MLLSEDGRTTDVSPESRKASFPMVTSVDGSEAVVREVQPRKASFLMVTSVDGSETVVREVQP